MAEKRWGDHEGFEVRGGTVAISPDGSKLACNFMATPPSLLHILDLKTGKVTVGPETTKDADNPSWSPDGRRIAFAKEVERRKNGLLIPPLRAVYVLDVEAGTVSKIADGGSPSWSPSGEWIAFYGYSPRPPNDGKGGGYDVGEDLLSLVRPDGTRSKVLRGKLPDRELPPIWSPDSTTILMNRPQQDSVNPKVDVYLLDIATLKLTKKFKMVPPVYGWVAAK
jgi:Tol biopolymer transport system component